MEETRPVPKVRADPGTALLRAQGAVCLLILLAVLLCREAMPPLYAAAKAEYARRLEADALTQELARFASAAMDMASMTVFADGKAPQGASGEVYAPKQESRCPVAGYTVSSAYGWRSHPTSGKQDFHRGVDLACAEGTPIAAAMDGVVAYTGRDASAGNYVRLHHAGGVDTVYCHMQYAFVRAGETVRAGQLLGTVGQTGEATGPHLHLSLLYNDVYYDPSALLQ